MPGFLAGDSYTVFITNNNGMPVAIISMTIGLYDSSGMQIGTDYANPGTVAPGNDSDTEQLFASELPTEPVSCSVLSWSGQAQ